MKLNITKTNVIVISKTPRHVRVAINGETYILGSILLSDLEATQMLDSWISIGKTVFNKEKQLLTDRRTECWVEENNWEESDMEYSHVYIRGVDIRKSGDRYVKCIWKVGVATYTKDQLDGKSYKCGSEMLERLNEERSPMRCIEWRQNSWIGHAYIKMRMFTERSFSRKIWR